MQSKTKIILAVFTIAVFICGAVYLGKDGSQFTGRIDKQLAFFRATPEKEKVIDNTFVSYKEGAAVLINASLSAGRITDEQAHNFIELYDSDSKISRAEFAALAVEIFNLELKGQGGPHISDVNSRDRNARAIYTCVMNGCLDIEFKPQNQATWDFVNNVGENLQARFNQ